MLQSIVACYVGHGAMVRIARRHCSAISRSRRSGCERVADGFYNNDMPAELTEMRIKEKRRKKKSKRKKKKRNDQTVSEDKCLGGAEA